MVRIDQQPCEAGPPPEWLGPSCRLPVGRRSRPILCFFDAEDECNGRFEPIFDRKHLIHNLDCDRRFVFSLYSANRSMPCKIVPSWSIFLDFCSYFGVFVVICLVGCSNVLALSSTRTGRMGLFVCLFFYAIKFFGSQGNIFGDLLLDVVVVQTFHFSLTRCRIRLSSLRLRTIFCLPSDSA